MARPLAGQVAFAWSGRKRAKPASKGASEAAFQRAIVDMLERRGGGLWVWRQNSGKAITRDRSGAVRGVIQLAPAGAGDLTGIVAPEGWRIEVEIKAAKGVVREAQEKWRDFIVCAGGVYVTCRYDASVGAAENVRRAVRAIDDAIEARRAR